MNHYSFEDLSVGMEEHFEVELTQERMERFCEITGDVNPLHRDGDFAKGMGFDNRVAYGMLTASFLSTLAGVYLPGERSLIHRVEAEFPRPVYIGDRLTVCGRVQELNEAFRVFTMKVTVTNQRGEKVCRGKMRIGFLAGQKEE